jgi:DNA polymerase-3 subunit gamma/tau
MSQALYNKFRPHLWDQVVGQDHVVETLRNAIRGSRVGHAYLFAGPRGTGKTTTARLLAKAVNCLEEDLAKRPCDLCLHCTAVNDGRFLDLIEIDAASNTSVDDVRALREKINYSPSQGRFKVYLIDEVHMLSTAAFNALLKTLEEPPAHAIFILATTEVHKIPATVLSRCQRHEFRRIPVIDIVTNLKLLAGHEKITVEDEALTLIARQATGSMRDAISLFDQLASTGQDITLSGAQKVLGTAASAAVVSMVDAILSQQTGKGLDEIHHALDAGSDPRQFARQVVDYLRGLMLIRLGNADQVDVTVEMRDQMHQHARAYDTSRLMDAIRLFNSAAWFAARTCPGAEYRNRSTACHPHPSTRDKAGLTTAASQERACQRGSPPTGSDPS